MTIAYVSLNIILSYRDCTYIYNVYILCTNLIYSNEDSFDQIKQKLLKIINNKLRGYFLGKNL